VAIATSLVIAVTAVGEGVNATQSRMLTPLAAIGADLVVTRDASLDASNPRASDEVVSQNAEAVKTDLAQLGKPGDHFTRDFFLPGTQLTMPVTLAQQVARDVSAEASSEALAMVVTHQEGTVPTIVATFQTGGQTINIDQQIPQMTQAEIDQTNACIKGMHGPPLVPPPGTPPGKGGTGPPTPEQIQTCLPERFKRFRETIVTPVQTITQVLNPPETDIKSSSLSVLGIDTGHMPGPLSAGQVSSGRFFSADPIAAAKEALVSEAYATHHQLTLGSSVTFNGQSFSVAGIVRTVIGVQSADVYISLPALQKLAGQDGNANVVFIRLRQGSDVDAAIHRIQAAYPGFRVTSNRDLANRISGSVAQAGSLAQKGSRLLALIVFVVTVLFVSILSWAGVHSRTRELGTLRAIGWSRLLLVRQVLSESLALSVLGAVFGTGLGLVAARALQAWLPPLSASLAGASSDTGQFGLGNLAPAFGSSATLRIAVTPNTDLVLAAMALAIAAGVVAGVIGTLLTARVQPIQAVQRLT
jgi:hypothetical protein